MRDGYALGNIVETARRNLGLEMIDVRPNPNLFFTKSPQRVKRRRRVCAGYALAEFRF